MRSVVAGIVVLLTSAGAKAEIGSCANDHAVIDLAYANKLIVQSEGDRLIKKIHHGKCDGKMPSQPSIDQEKTYLINTVQISRSTLSAFISNLNNQPSLTPAEEQSKRDHQAKMAERARQDREAKAESERKRLAIVNAKKSEEAEKKANREKTIMEENKACIDEQHTKLEQKKKVAGYYKVAYDLEFSDDRGAVYVTKWSYRDKFMREVKKESRFTCNSRNPEIASIPTEKSVDDQKHLCGPQMANKKNLESAITIANGWDEAKYWSNNVRTVWPEKYAVKDGKVYIKAKWMVKEVDGRRVNMSKPKESWIPCP